MFLVAWRKLSVFVFLCALSHTHKKKKKKKTPLVVLLSIPHSPAFVFVVLCQHFFPVQILEYFALQLFPTSVHHLVVS